MLLVAPEHRLSLKLMQTDLALDPDKRCNKLAAPVEHLLEGFPFIDIIDESDEVLHHQLRACFCLRVHWDVRGGGGGKARGSVQDNSCMR